MKTACLFPNDPQVGSSSCLARWGFAAFLALAGACSADASGVAAACETELLWAVQAGGPGDDYGAVVRTEEGLALRGAFFPPATFGAGEPHSVVFGDGGPCFMALYEADGSLGRAPVETTLMRADGAPRCIFAPTPDGGKIVRTNFQATVTINAGEPDETTLAGSDDIVLAKLSPDGALAWAVTAGGRDADDVNDLAVAMDGSIFLTGSFSGTATFGAGGPTETTLVAAGAELLDPNDFSTKDIFVARYQADGALAWVKRAGGNSGAFGIEDGTGVAVAPDGSIFVTGTISSAATFGPNEANETTLTPTGEGVLFAPGDIFVAKYGPDGSLAWAKQAGGERAELGGKLQIASDGTLLVSGSFESRATFGAREPAETTIEAPGPDGKSDLFIARYGDDGGLIWVSSFGSGWFGIHDGQEYAGDVAVGEDGTTFVIGTTLWAHQLFPLVAAFETDGVLRWFEHGDGDAGVGSIVVDDDGNPIAAGGFTGRLTWRPGQADETTLTADDSDPDASYPPNDVFMAKFQAACPTE